MAVSEDGADSDTLIQERAKQLGVASPQPKVDQLPVEGDSEDESSKQRHELLAEIASLGQDMEEMESTLRRYRQKEEEFINQMDRHFEDVRRNEKTLQATLESLEVDNSALRTLLKQQDSEQDWLQHRESESIEQCAQTERRIQVLMDKLVVLLSSGSSTQHLHDQIVEDLSESTSKIQVMLQSVQANLELARQENRDAAVRLSEEQRKTKRLHDELCETQGDLFRNKLTSSPAQSTTSSLELGRFKVSTPRWNNGRSASLSLQPGPPEAGAGGWTMPSAMSPPQQHRPPTPSPMPVPEVPVGSPSMPSRPARDRLPAQSLAILEDHLQQVLTRVAYEDEVIRVTSGVYRFGNEKAFLRLSMEGEVWASVDELTWEPILDFVQGLRHRRNGLVRSPLQAAVEQPGRREALASVQGGYPVVRMADSPSPADDAAGHGLRIPLEVEESTAGKRDENRYLLEAKQLPVQAKIVDLSCHRGAQHAWTKSGGDRLGPPTARGTPRRNREPLHCGTPGARSARRQDQTSSGQGGLMSPSMSKTPAGHKGGGSGSFSSLGGGGGSLGGVDGGSLTSIGSAAGGASSASSLSQASPLGGIGYRSRGGATGSQLHHHAQASTPTPSMVPSATACPSSPRRMASVGGQGSRQHLPSSISPPRAAVKNLSYSPAVYCMSPQPATAASASQGLNAAGFVRSPARRRPSAVSVRAPSCSSQNNSPTRSPVPSRPGSVGVPVRQPSGTVARSATSGGGGAGAGGSGAGVVALHSVGPEVVVSTSSSSSGARPFREASPLPQPAVAGTRPAVHRGRSPLGPPVSNPSQLLSANAVHRVLSIAEVQGAATPTATRYAVRASSASPTPQARMCVRSPLAGPRGDHGGAL